MIKKNLPTLKIHKLKRDQYNEIKSANAISDNEIYEITDAAVITDTEKTGYDTHIANSDIHVTADEKAVWNESDVFVATYGTTTFDEILNAYNSGKTIMAKYNSNIYQLASADTSMSFMFVSVAKGSEYVNYVECEFTGDWYTYVGKRFLPDAGTANNGKVLMVVNGAWAATAITKPTTITTTLTASNWDSTAKTYSFEADYPNASYDIEIALDSTATTAQAEAFNSAQIVGSATSNVVKAYGIVPTVDIPVIVKAVTK